MSLLLTPLILRQSYELLAATEPFIRWNLPDSEDITFRVAKDKTCYGWQEDKRGKRHKIFISQHNVGSLFTLLEIMAHELIHVYTVCAKIRDTSEHGVAFRKLADRVCKVHTQFDRRRF